jgi:tRNA 2-thiouridine synthesizing protein C
VSYPLIVLSRTPYHGSLPRSALDLAMAFAVFDQRPKLLFIGDGVLQLLPSQQPSDRPSLEKVIASLPLYDVEECYATADALTAADLDPDALPLPVTALDPAALQALFAGASSVLSL